MSNKCFLNTLARSILLFILLVIVNTAITAPRLPPLSHTLTGKQFTGKFIWFDLATFEIDKEKEFYRSVFGWTFHPISKTNDQYAIISNGKRNVAGIFSIKSSAGAKPGALWIGLMSVVDPVKSVNLAKQSGGIVHTPPKYIANRGKYALIRDPEGALFGILKASSGDPPDGTVGIDEFLWMDLFVKDQKKAGDFYQKLANYEIESRDIQDGKRLVLNSFGRARAGIVPLPQDVDKAGWLPYVRVASIEATLKKVVAAGGFIMVPPQPDLYDGNLAIFSDPQGGVLGIIK